jgi:hypothetical protein
MDISIGEKEQLEVDGATSSRKDKKERKRKGKMDGKDEKDEELKRLQREVDEWKSKATEMEKEKKMNETALGFTVEKYLSLSYVMAAKWIAMDIRQAFRERMDENPDKFYWTKLVKGKYSMGARTCARFNRGEYCNNGKWHAVKATKRSDDNEAHDGDREPDKDLRLHGCTLCVEALGIWSVHPVVECPWVHERTWANLGK